MTPIEITIMGDPVPKGRARVTTRGTYTPAKTRQYEKIVADAAIEAMAGDPPTEGLVQVYVSAVFGIPASWPAWKRELVMTGQMSHGSRPDLDNIIKIVTDGMNGIVYKDDCQIHYLSGFKSFGPEPQVKITVEPTDVFNSAIKTRAESNANTPDNP